MSCLSIFLPSILSSKSNHQISLNVLDTTPVKLAFFLFEKTATILRPNYNSLWNFLAEKTFNFGLVLRISFYYFFMRGLVSVN